MDQKREYSEEDLQALELEHKDVLLTADPFSKELAHQIERLLEEEGVALGFPIQQRVKSWSSLSEKLERVGFQVTSVKDFQDLVGLRLIVLFKRDVIKVCDVISNNFNVIRRYDTQERMKDDRFGYSSVHFIVELRPDWLAVPTLSKMAGLKAEIQLRTLAQHTWAEASSNLQYKKKESVPLSIGRAINRVSALLETVDLEFERVLVERDNYRSEVDVSGTEDLLNVDLIEKTLDSVLPKANKGGENFAELLEDLMKFGIEKQQQLRDLVMRHLPAILEDERAAISSILNHARINRTPVSDRHARGVMLNHIGLVRVALRQEFPGFSAYLNQKSVSRLAP
jgi:ppGpp synthetase/RelA/SpoT-type nucleotidyltranferase